MSVGIRGVGESGVYWMAGRDSRYSGARRGIGGIRAMGAPRGVGPFWGVGSHFGVSGGVRVYWGLAGTLCTQGQKGIGA